MGFSFHVFVDARKIGEMFWPVFYASLRLSSTENNYSVKEREALGMIYSVTKFCHYLLGSKFFFHVDHSTLLYLVAKQALHGKIFQWMLILTEFEFTIIHTPGLTHLLADYLSRLESGEASIGIKDVFRGAFLFLIVKIDVHSNNWYDQMHQFFYYGLFPSTFCRDRQKWLALQSWYFKVIVDHLYRVGGDGLLRWCVPPHEIAAVLAESHQGIRGGHFARDNTTRKILQSGYGGQSCGPIWLNGLRIVILVNGWVSRLSKIEWSTTRFFHLKLLKNGD